MGGYIALLKQNGKHSSVCNDDNSYSYRASHWHTIKGDVLRAAIAYLDTVKEGANAMEAESARQFFIDAGIIYKPSKNHEKVFSRGIKAIDAALDVLRSWVREPENNGEPIFLDVMDDLGQTFGLSFEKMAKVRKVNKMVEDKDLDGLSDLPYRGVKILDTIYCPLELANVGMRGMFPFMRLGDNGQLIYPDEAQLMVPMLEKVITVMEDPDLKYSKEGCELLRDLFARCVDGYIIQGPESTLFR